jgi:serine/threonine protein kinase/Tfp pilus assembly protein PilF
MSEFQPVRFWKYLLLEKIATGGMAQLYRAKITGIQGFEKLIAIKVILPHLAKEKELVSAFIDEAKLAALLNHQNIVQIYDFGRIEDSYFISMEYLHGKDLRAVVAKSKEKNLPLTLEHALYITSCICSGLDYAYKLKDFSGTSLHIIHRDISPQNIFVTYEGGVKILDFGIAKAASQSTITQFGMIKGKVAYMSPEQAAGKSIDQRSDIFSTGILLYEMVTGARMFVGESTMQILEKVREAVFDRAESMISGLPLKLYEILDRVLAKAPEDRYQTCGEMFADLEECMIELYSRSTGRGLAQYMKELFEEDIVSEAQFMRDITDGRNIELEEKERTKESEQHGLPAIKTGEKPLAEPEAPLVEVASKASHTIQELASEEQPEKKIGKKVWPLYVSVAVLIIVIGMVLGLWRGQRQTRVQQKVSGSAAPTSKVAQAMLPTKAPTTTSNPEPAKVRDIAREVQKLMNQASLVVDTDPGKARALLVEAIKLDPTNVQARSQLGLVYVKQKNYTKAIETYQTVAEMDPQFPNIYFNLGYVYAMSKNYPKAEEMYLRVVKSSPFYLDEALFNLGMVQSKQGKQKEAVENFKQALSVNPKNELARKELNKPPKKTGKLK